MTRCIAGCGCGRHTRAQLTKADLEIVGRVFGFASSSEFEEFLARQGGAVRDTRGPKRMKASGT